VPTQQKATSSFPIPLSWKIRFSALGQLAILRNPEPAKATILHAGHRWDQKQETLSATTAKRYRVPARPTSILFGTKRIILKKDPVFPHTTRPKSSISPSQVGTMWTIKSLFRPVKDYHKEKMKMNFDSKMAGGDKINPGGDPTRVIEQGPTAKAAIPSDLPVQALHAAKAGFFGSNRAIAVD
jgi:hypothetical protein